MNMIKLFLSGAAALIFLLLIPIIIHGFILGIGTAIFLIMLPQFWLMVLGALIIRRLLF